MITTRRPARLRMSDSMIVCGAISIAFASFVAPYYPDITRYELWSSAVKSLVFLNGFGLAAFAGGYWLARRR